MRVPTGVTVPRVPPSPAARCAFSEGQNLALTGSIDQRGQVQAVGGVNEKVEGFYRVTCDHCREHIEELAMNDDGNFKTFLRIHEEKDATEQNVVQIFPEGPHVTHLSLKHEPPPYLLQTPADLTFENGVITEAREGIE